MTYPEAVRYLESLINYEAIPAYPYKESLKLERSKGFLNTIDNPQDSFRAIHIAGTKGKGSTCAFITYILREAGYKVGLYTSPHLLDFRERIRILVPQCPSAPVPQLKQDFEGMISEEELIDLVKRLKGPVENYNKNSKYGPLSFFEVYTALAFVYFKERKVDFAVLETGLGGKLDATNAVHPLVCAITPISYEHTQKLGNTLKEIATEKAGIIKPNTANRTPQTVIVISAPQQREAREVIRNKCKKVGAKLYEVEKDIFYEKTRKGFNVLGMFGEYPNMETRLLGEHQIINASVAIGVIEALRFYDIIVGIGPIRGGLYNTAWPGRCEVVSKNPLVVLDGAQNIASARALKETIKEKFRYKRLILVLGISQDKDIKGICNEFIDLADTVVLTRANNPRATEPKILAKFFMVQESIKHFPIPLRKSPKVIAEGDFLDGKKLYLTDSVKEAREKIYHLAQKEDLVLVTGSLFVVGEFRDGSL